MLSRAITISGRGPGKAQLSQHRGEGEMGAGCDGVGVDVSQTHAVTRKGFFQLWCPQAGHKTKRWVGYRPVRYTPHRFLCRSLY